MSTHPPHIKSTRAGEFIAARRSGENVTLWIEGRDQDGPSVAGTQLGIDGLRELIRKLTAQLRHIEAIARKS